MADPSPDLAAELADLRQRLDSLETRAQAAEDHLAIANLQRAYGYYVDKSRWEHVADLFARDAVLEINGRGRFNGHERIRAYMRHFGPPKRGLLMNHMQLQPVIHVEPDGSYSIPEGNLFAPGTPQTRPEIYLMGLRNPFRFAVNRDTGVLYLADYSPDARAASPLRGPVGTGKWLAVREPGNYGWPYCATPELPYVAYNFASGASGEAFDCQHPVNHSSHNTGLVDLPPVLEPELAYSFGGVPGWPELGSGGVGPMAGPAYVFSEARSSSLQWPAQYSGLPLFYEWTRDLVIAFQLSPDGALEGMEPLPFTLDNPMDMEFGPDGALYALEYGDGYYQINADAQLTRIEYTAPQE